VAAGVTDKRIRLAPAPRRWYTAGGSLDSAGFWAIDFEGPRRFSRVLRSTGRPGVSEVILSDDENFERALKRFKKKCERAGVLSDLRKHLHFEKPSERRKRKMNAAVRKNRRARSV
jgi:small subunit ribosomal protein S21